LGLVLTWLKPGGVIKCAMLEMENDTALHSGKSGACLVSGSGVARSCGGDVAYVSTRRDKDSELHPAVLALRDHALPPRVLRCEMAAPRMVTVPQDDDDDDSNNSAPHTPAKYSTSL